MASRIRWARNQVVSTIVLARAEVHRRQAVDLSKSCVKSEIESRPLTGFWLGGGAGWPPCCATLNRIFCMLPKPSFISLSAWVALSADYPEPVVIPGLLLGSDFIMTNKPSLNTAYARVKRAGEHIEDLKRLYNTLIAAKANSIVIKDIMERPILHGESGFIYEISNPPVTIPEDFRILVGDAANSLRAALNYLIGRLCELDSGRKGSQTQFPIEDLPEKFKGNRPRFLEGINDMHVAAIQRLQPYNGCEWAAHLQRLSNLDKHDDLVIIQDEVLAQFSVMSAEGKAGEATMHMEVEPTFRIALGNGLPVIETLETIKASVTETLDAFKSEFE
jgi:hypothetical protein